MKKSNKLVVHYTDEEHKDLCLAWASTYEIEAMVEADGFIEIYTADQEYTELCELLISKANISSANLKVEEVIHQNWNKEWEENFKPVAVDNIYIRAPFHEASDKHDIDLIISPKMAFGTGHHETTYMMLQYMNKMDLTEKKVLDYGCGTGILTVFAKMRGCEKIDAIDIQEEAIENTTEHFELNNVSTATLRVKQGDLDILSDNTYDVILANINRHVLLKNTESLRSFLSEDGILIMSGILKTDRELILSTYNECGFTILGEDQKGEWCCFRFG